MKSITTVELHKYSGYSSGLYFLPELINTLRLQLPDGGRREITHPVIARDFVSGLLEDGKSHGFFRRSCLTSVEFTGDSERELPELIFTRKTAGELLSRFPFPALFRVSYRAGAISSSKVGVLGVHRGFLVTDFQFNPAIPIAALSAIEIECA